MNKRSFLKKSLGAAAGLCLGGSEALAGNNSEKTLPIPCAAPGLAGNHSDFWAAVRAEYDLPHDFINLESGYYGIMPRPVQQAFFRHVEEVNRLGARYMRTVQFQNKQRVAARIARTIGCSEDELIITRNTTESLDLVIAGFPWQPGDEALMAVHDYGAMIDMFRQVALRHGIRNRFVKVPIHPASDEEIVQVYEEAITDRTRLLMLCHIINITGQILPVRKICDMAHRHGVQVMVDGAHAFAQFGFNLNGLNCDYYGASLHKWLSAPLGAGILYVRREHVPNLWPLLAEAPTDPASIARLNHTGTLPVHTDLAIENALDYYESLGPARKEERLRYLRSYWMDRLKGLPRIILNTPQEAERACAIGNVGIEGMEPAEMSRRLFDEYRIFTVAIDHEGVRGCRITPNVFTTEAELDILVKAVGEMAG